MVIKNRLKYNINYVGRYKGIKSPNAKMIKILARFLVLTSETLRSYQSIFKGQMLSADVTPFDGIISSATFSDGSVLVSTYTFGDKIVNIGYPDTPPIDMER